MNALIACDLDRTMIYSAAAAGIGDAGTSDADLVCVEYLNGAPLSYMTQNAAGLLQTITATTTFVPTTTRTVEQYGRIRLPGGPHRYAVTSNGGNILVDSEPDRRWRADVDARIKESSAPLDAVVTALQSWIGPEWVHKLRVADDLFCYLVVDLAAIPDGFVAEWAQWCGARNWSVSVQGRKIYAVPATLCKSVAVAEVRRRLDHPTDLVLAAGDGALDAELLRYADKAIRPAHGELHALDFRAPGIVVTSVAGAAAAEEILRWMSTTIEDGVAAAPNQA